MKSIWYEVGYISGNRFKLVERTTSFAEAEAIAHRLSEKHGESVCVRGWVK